MNIAAEGSDVLMELEVPGADIVGFEYAAKTDADRKAVDAAVTTLATPLDLFVLPSAAGCSVAEARAAGKKVWLHTDATQAVGKLPVDVGERGVDHMSFTAHKQQGPKCVGA